MDPVTEKIERENFRRPQDLEIKDAQLIFSSVWHDLESEFGLENLSFPREIFWLNGAPGAGKGTQTRFIMQYKGLTAPPIVISQLLTSHEAKRLKDAGMMVGDREVTALLFRRLLDPRNLSGVVVDGFPRTKVQVECLKLFYNRLDELRRNFYGTLHESRFPRPIFHIVVLYVDETISVHRQLHRGRKHRVSLRQDIPAEERDSTLDDVRKTDLDPESARNRYRTFKEVTYPALASLREVFYYHFINAQDSIEKVQDRILDELKYQSTLELEQETNDLLSGIAIATDIILHARQELVRRLNEYAEHHHELFSQVIAIIQEKMMPVVIKHAISGEAYFNSENPVFNDPLALAMAIDIFSERGYHASINIWKENHPQKIDMQTGDITCKEHRVYRFRIRFHGSEIRRGR